jgi:hypothetical protein
MNEMLSGVCTANACILLSCYDYCTTAAATTTTTTIATATAPATITPPSSPIQEKEVFLSSKTALCPLLITCETMNPRKIWRAFPTLDKAMLKPGIHWCLEEDSNSRKDSMCLRLHDHCQHHYVGFSLITRTAIRYKMFQWVRHTGAVYTR